MISLLITFIIAFLASLLVTPIVRWIAISRGIVDCPDRQRKLHGRVVARAGGTAVLFATLLGCGFAFIEFSHVFKFLANGTLFAPSGVISEEAVESVLELDFVPYLGVMIVMIGVCLLGLADDIWSLRGRQKLAGQALLAGILVLTGTQVQSVSVFGIPIQLGLFAAPLTIIWLLATTNALNLVDGSDGFCSTIGAIVAGSMAIMASYHHQHAEAAIGFALCGALLGFLLFNFPPASIFLGDSGSLLVGLVTGALAIRCALKGPATVAMLAPACLLVIPLFDSAMAIIRRKLTGRSIYTTDRAHIHHILKNSGFSDRGLLAITAAMCLFVSAGAIGGMLLGHEWLAAGSALTVVAILIVSKLFGFAEMSLLARRVSHFAASMVEPAANCDSTVRQKAVRLQGTRSWELIWATLTEFAERQQLSRVHLDLNVPWLHEGFHATWQRSKMPDKLERWTTSLPLFADGRLAGRLDIIGPVADGKAFSSLAQLADVLEDLAPQLELLVSRSGLEPKIKLVVTGTENPDPIAVLPSRAS